MWIHHIKPIIWESIIYFIYLRKPRVSFINSLYAVFCQFRFAKESKYRNAAHNTFVRKKLLVKCWWNWCLPGIDATNISRIDSGTENGMKLQNLFSFPKHYHRFAASCVSVDFFFPTLFISSSKSKSSANSSFQSNTTEKISREIIFFLSQKIGC